MSQLFTSNNTQERQVGRATAPHKTALSVAAQGRTLTILTILLLVGFTRPIYDLVRFALRSDLFSHILLVPFISGYLAFVRRTTVRFGAPPKRTWSIVWGACALVALLGYWLDFRSDSFVSPTNYLCWAILCFFFLFVASCQFCLGPQTLRDLAFPIGFLVFMAPFPDWLTAAFETFLQHSSAIAAQVLFGLTGTAALRTGLRFQLPGITLEVAPECSGIHSTLVLFITSLLAGQLFLRSSWKRAFLCLVVVPLGIIRNAVRICTIGLLCAHIGPHMIDSPIHHRGGPLFFAASLVPFFLFLWFLRRSELRTQSLQPKLKV